MYELYGSWDIEDAEAVGTTFTAVCSGDRGMERHLTKGKVYTVLITPRILSSSPLCSFVGDSGKVCEAHLERFEKHE